MEKKRNLTEIKCVKFMQFPSNNYVQLLLGIFIIFPLTYFVPKLHPYDKFG